MTPLRARVLVLMASYNGEAWIRRQIDSVLAQRGVEVQLLVSDDHSTDRTLDILASVSNADPRVRCVVKLSGPHAAAANFFSLISSADVSHHDYIALCDQDDEWFPDKLERAVAAMRATAAQGYSAAVTAEWPDGRRHVLAQCPRTRAGDYLFEGAGQGCTFVLHATLFLRLKATLEQFRPLQATFHYHDWTLYALARAGGAHWHFDASPTMMYRQHAANDTGARSSGSGIGRRLQLIRSGWYGEQVAAITRLVLAAHPDNLVAAEWVRIAARHANASTMRKRFRALVFVARNGRRRGADRLIQMAAVLLGYL